MEAPLCNELTAPQTVIVKSQPAVNYAYLPQPLVARPYAGDTVVINAKPTVVYDSPKRIIYRKITCYRYVLLTRPAKDSTQCCFDSLHPLSSSRIG